MRFTICRIVGNELPPRDTPGSKLDSLRWLIANDRVPGVHYAYVINHIVDPAYREEVLAVLKGQDTVEMPFDPTMYWQLPDTDSKIRYAININAARNFGIRYCQASSDFVACLDQECYFQPDEVDRIIKNIAADQSEANFRRHYGVVSKRFHISEIPEDFSKYPDAEPMVIVRHDATRLFDESLKFGAADKLELLSYMGYTVGAAKVRLRGDRARTVGICLHVSFGDREAEHDIIYRGEQRALSLKRLLERIDELYPRKK